MEMTTDPDLENDTMKTHQTAAASSKSGTRRPSIMPRNVRTACKQVSKYRIAIANQIDVWDRSLFDWVAEAAPEKLTGDLLKELRQTRREVVASVKACEEFGGKLERAIHRVKRVLALREELRAAGSKRRDVHEPEAVEREWDDLQDEEIEVEEDEDVEVKPEEDEDVDVEAEEAAAEAHKGNDRRLSVKEKIARARAREDK
jgi:hypothetical protein